MNYLSSVALPASVGIKEARVFRDPKDYLLAVAQTQRKLDLGINPAINPALLDAVAVSSLRTETLRGIESLLLGTEALRAQGFLPDIAPSSGNLRVSFDTGAVTLIDLMPARLDGSRLIGDKVHDWVPHIEGVIEYYETIVGKAGGSVG